MSDRPICNVLQYHTITCVSRVVCWGWLQWDNRYVLIVTLLQNDPSWSLWGVHLGLIVQIFLWSMISYTVIRLNLCKKKKRGGVYSLYMYIILYTPASFFLAQIESTPLLHSGAKNKSFFSIHYSKVELLKISLCCVWNIKFFKWIV